MGNHAHSGGITPWTEEGEGRRKRRSHGIHGGVSSKTANTVGGNASQSCGVSKRQMWSCWVSYVLSGVWKPCSWGALGSRLGVPPAHTRQLLTYSSKPTVAGIALRHSHSKPLHRRAHRALHRARARGTSEDKAQSANASGRKHREILSKA